VPILAIAASISLLIGVRPASLLVTAVFVLVGSGLYGLARRQTRSQSTEVAQAEIANG
jgi:hypothetical protein